MSENNSSGLGCVGTIVAALIIWGFFFGVTVNGHHYSVNCTCEKGVVVQ